MGFIIALGVEIALIAVIYSVNKKNSKKKKKECFDKVFIIGIVLSVFTAAFGTIFNCSDIPILNSQYDFINYEKTVKSNNIVALQDGNQVEGYGSSTLFLGSGRINEKMYYCCYIETDNGYQFYKISPEDENVYVKYCDKDEQPRIEQLCTYEKAVLKEKPKYSFWYSLPLYFKTRNMKVGDVLYDEAIEVGWFEKEFSYTIYVPKGSIVQDYKLDMQKE